MAKFSSNPGKLHFEGLVHLLTYIRENNNLVLIYYANIKDAPISDLLIEAIVNIDKQLVVLSDYIWKDCTDTGISIGSYIVFCQGGTIDHCIHIPGTVDQ